MWAHSTAIIFIFVALSQTPAYAVRPLIWANASRGVPIYAPAFASTKWSAYGRTDATASPSSLASVKSRMVYLSGAGLPVCPGNRPFNGRSSCCCWASILMMIFKGFSVICHFSRHRWHVKMCVTYQEVVVIVVIFQNTEVFAWKMMEEEMTLYVNNHLLFDILILLVSSICKLKLAFYSCITL